MQLSPDKRDIDEKLKRLFTLTEAMDRERQDAVQRASNYRCFFGISLAANGCLVLFLLILGTLT
jgi:hypothetical protein